MKRIEDAPKELKQVFEIVFQEWLSKSEYVHQAECEHFFLKGFDVAMATNGLPERPKRTIEHVYANDKSVFVLSNDKKVFALRITPEGFQWVKQPDLPQDET